MRGHFVVAFLVLWMSQANLGDQLKGKLKPEKGKQDCEYYLAGKYPAGIWEGVYNENCKRDSQNRTIKAKPVYFKALKGLYDPCCTEYMGLVCRQIYNEKRGNGYCGKPNPHQTDMGFGRDDHLSMIKAKKIADGQQLDSRWNDVD